MKLSIVIICWNDLKVIIDCLKSVFEKTTNLEFEVIISDNGSSDGSPDCIRQLFPQARIVANGENLGFAKGNNAGINAARGEYVLILNPDTIIHDRALETLVAFADRHPEAGAFGCRVTKSRWLLPEPCTPHSHRFGLSHLCPVSTMAWPPLTTGRFRSLSRLGRKDRATDWLPVGMLYSVSTRRPATVERLRRPFLFSFRGERSLLQNLAVGTTRSFLPGGRDHSPRWSVRRPIPDPFCAGNI